MGNITPERVVKSLHHTSEATSPELVKPLHHTSEATSPESSLNHPYNHPLNIGASSEKPEEARPQSRKKGDAIDGMLAFRKKPGEKDITYFPEDVLPVLGKFIALFPVDIPRKPTNGRGGQYAQWINECRLLKVACGDFGLNVLDTVAKDCGSLTISHPGALLSMVRSEVGKMRKTAGSEYRVRENEDGTQDFLPPEFSSWSEFDNERQKARDALKKAGVIA